MDFFCVEQIDNKRIIQIVIIKRALNKIYHLAIWWIESGTTAADASCRCSSS